MYYYKYRSNSIAIHPHNSNLADLTSDPQLLRHPQLNAKPVYPVHVWSRRVDGLLTTTARSRKCATRGQRFTSASGRNCSPVRPEVRERTVRRSSLSVAPLASTVTFERNYEFWLGNSSQPLLLIPPTSSLLQAKDSDMMPILRDAEIFRENVWFQVTSRKNMYFKYIYVFNIFLCASLPLTKTKNFNLKNMEWEKERGELLFSTFINSIFNVFDTY